MSVLLVGEDNPYGSDPRFALYPSPDGCSGHRLMKILGLPVAQYVDLERVNLCDSGAWSMKAARKRAKDIATELTEARTIVMCGRKVADAFGYELPFFSHSKSCDYASLGVGRHTFVSIPHPSGRNTIWNAIGCVARARDIMREIEPAYTWSMHT